MTPIENSELAACLRERMRDHEVYKALAGGRSVHMRQDCTDGTINHFLLVPKRSKKTVYFTWSSHYVKDGIVHVPGKLERNLPDVMIGCLVNFGGVMLASYKNQLDAFAALTH